MDEHASRLAGLRYACLVRCSTDPQADKSIPDQLQVLHDSGQKERMIHAGDAADFILPGVSGSHPAAREDIADIIRRKKEFNDFDVLLVQDIGRLTRGGVEHGGKIEFDLATAGIKVVFAGSPMPDGEHAGIIKSVEYFAAQQFAKSVSFGVARGQMSAILSGTQAHCLRPPFGIDRLYVSIDGRPQHIVRNLTDGRQQKLNPQTLKVMQTYPKPVKGTSPVRCRKQAGERIVLIPGAEQEVETVRHMFKRALIDGWGDWRIAKELNDRKIPSPTGKTWKRRSVSVILRNPVYVGTGIANRRSGARYTQRSRNAPEKIPYELTDVASQRRPTNRHRPRTEWVEQQHPALVEFLGSDLRALAVEYQRRFLTGELKKPAIKKDKHVDSKFFLKNVLRSKQGDIPLTGRTQGTKEKPYRYYYISRSCAYPSSDQTMRRTVRAEPIERAVLDAVRETLMRSTVRERIIEIMLQQNAETVDQRANLDALRQEQQGLQDQIGFVIDELSVIGRDAARRKIQQLEGRLATINDQISRVAAPSKTMSRADVENAADRAMAQINALAASLDRMAPHALRELIASMVVRLEVDLETQAFSLELRLPAWAISAQDDVEARMGLDAKFLQKATPEAQIAPRTILATFDCLRSEKDCYDCRRPVAA